MFAVAAVLVVAMVAVVAPLGCGRRRRLRAVRRRHRWLARRTFRVSRNCTPHRRRLRRGEGLTPRLTRIVPNAPP